MENGLTRVCGKREEMADARHFFFAYFSTVKKTL